MQARPDTVTICDIAIGSIEPEPCPSNSPTAEGIPTTPGSVITYFGPLLATRTEAGFDRIASTGGYAGSAI